MSSNQRQKLTPPQYAKQLGVSTSKILDWIHSGELRAINVGNGNLRPRFLIDIEDISAFENRRSVCPQPKINRIRRRRNREVKDFV